jgi:hypothetical protein
MDEREADALLAVADILSALPVASQVRVLQLFQAEAVSAALKYVRSNFAELQQQSRTGAVERREALAFLEAIDNLLAQVA